LVNEQGEVTEASAIRGVQHLTEAAVEAVRKWRFEPAVKDGKRVKVYATVALDFRLPS
jgi:TonB family protein